MKFSIGRSSCVYETFSPLYKALKLFGIISFDMNLRNGEVRVKCRDVSWMVAMWMLWTCLIIWNIRLGAREPGEASKLILTGWHSVLIFQLFASFYIQIVGLFKRKSVGELLRLLCEVDAMVICSLEGLFSLKSSVPFQNLSMPNQEDHSRVKRQTISFIVCCHLANILISIFTYIANAANFSWFNFDFWWQSSYCFVNIVYMLTFHQFIFMTSNINSRLKLLNRNLT